MTIVTTTKQADVPEFDTDPYGEEFLLDPYPFLDRMRELAPVVYLPKYDTYAAAGYDDVRTILSDFSRFSSAAGIGIEDIREPGASRAPSPILDADPPGHTVNRAAFAQIFSPRVIRSWNELFARRAEEVVEKALEKGEVDAVADIVEPFVMHAFSEMAGTTVTKEIYRMFGELNGNLMGPMNERTIANLAAAKPLEERYQYHFSREGILPGGMAEQLYEAEDRGDLPPGTAMAHTRTLVRAGVDTTISGIGHCFHALARSPEDYETVRSDPRKLKNAFEEGLRLEAPVIKFYRLVLEDTELSGCPLKKGKKIAAYMLGANHDPRQFPNPEEFDLNRRVTGIHMAFGYGPHVCVGQMVARSEADAILGALTRKVKKIELIGEPRYRVINNLRQLDTLPVRLIAA